MVAGCEIHGALPILKLNDRGQSLRMAAPRLKAHVDAHVSEDGVGQVAVEVAVSEQILGLSRLVRVGA